MAPVTTFGAAFVAGVTAALLVWMWAELHVRFCALVDLSHSVTGDSSGAAMATPGGGTITHADDDPPTDLLALASEARSYAPHYDRAARLLRRFADSHVGMCEVDSERRIVSIDGGALRHAGQRPEAWIGADIGEPYASEAWPEIQRGESWLGVGVVAGQRVLVMYEPRGHLTDGAADGAVVWWYAVPDGYLVEVRRG